MSVERKSPQNILGFSLVNSVVGTPKISSILTETPTDSNQHNNVHDLNPALFFMMVSADSYVYANWHKTKRSNVQN